MSHTERPACYDSPTPHDNNDCHYRLSRRSRGDRGGARDQVPLDRPVICSMLGITVDKTQKGPLLFSKGAMPYRKGQVLGPCGGVLRLRSLARQYVPTAYIHGTFCNAHCVGHGE
jgi:hypothetical protein